MRSAFAELDAILSHSDRHGAILLYDIPRVVMGENRTFVGGEDYLRSRGVEVVNLDSAECLALMNEFIAAHPEIWNEDIGEE